MSTRLSMIITGSLPGVSVTQLCRAARVSRKTYYEMRGRYEKEGEDGLVPRSRRPLSSPGQIPAHIEQRICRLRAELPLDRGALAIFYEMQRAGDEPLPTWRTIHRVLKRNDLVEPQPQKRPKSAIHRFEYDQPNACWQIDATQWHLTRNRPAVIVDILDDHSRYLPASDAYMADTAAAAWQTFCHGAAECGPPAKMLSDNGASFTGRRLPGQPGTFGRNLAALGIAKANSRPHHPQTCGKLERQHQTLKKWLRRQRLAGSLAELQEQLDTYRDYYNNHRPHRALHGKTPAERFHATPRAQPAGVPLLAPPPPTLLLADRVVRASGRLYINSHTVYLGSRWAGHTLTVAAYGSRLAILDGVTLIRSITIEPDPTY
jgi:transposase InsO family protein